MQRKTISNRPATCDAPEKQQHACRSRRVLHDYNDEHTVVWRRSCAVEKTVSNARKRRISHTWQWSRRSSFEENVLRKAESIRSSAAC
ncbi:unnamed protein product [Gongylonema pulchrum]|uniref:Uncharacterized protein n=1 Tax=Gongylonema pulchrum TaxID=637853 RepID=A0A183D1K0_9BILA|nr:unnamed protein product [Gongylonema pulchrum]